MGRSYDKKMAKLEKQLFKVKSSKVRVAKRKLKYECSICGKPILKGQKYVIQRKYMGLCWLFRYVHLDCLKEE